MTANNIIFEVNTKNVEPYVNSMFSALPVDARYTKIEVARIEPKTVGSDTGGIVNTVFELDPLPQPQAYMWQDIMISVRIRILNKETKTLPALGSKISVIDNILGSLFSQVEVKVNTRRLDQDQQYYFLKAYVENLMTYGNDSTETWLEGTNGFTLDRFVYNETTQTLFNVGFETRQNLFREGRMDGQPWSDAGLHLCGKLYHEFSNVNKPLPFGTRVEFKFTRTSDDILLFQPNPNDHIQYMVDLQEFALFVPVATWTESVCRGIVARWNKEPLRYHFKSYQMIRKGLIKNNSIRISNIIPEYTRPTRIFLAIQFSHAIEPGSIDSNPFEFRRCWTYHTAELDQKIKIKEKEDFSKALKETARLAAESATQRAELAAAKKMEEMSNKLLKQQSEFMKEMFERFGSPTLRRSESIEVIPDQPTNTNSSNIPPPVAPQSKDNKLPVKGRKRKGQAAAGTSTAVAPTSSATLAGTSSGTMAKDFVVGGKARSNTSRSTRGSKCTLEEQTAAEKEFEKRNSFLSNSNNYNQDYEDDPDYIITNDLESSESSGDETGEWDLDSFISKSERETGSKPKKFKAPQVHIKSRPVGSTQTLNLRKLELQLNQVPLGNLIYEIIKTME